jgi:DNA repair protein RadC
MSIKFCPRYEIQLVRNGSERYRVEKHGSILGTSDAKRIVSDIVRAAMENSPCELVGVVTLDKKNVPIGFSIVTQGTLDSSLVHPREVFRLAIAQNAASLILVHNHPSGDLTPSEHDLEVTARLKECGHLLGIAVLDHIIVAMNINGEWESLSILEQ